MGVFDEMCAFFFLEFYMAFLPTFRNNISVPSSKFDAKKWLNVSHVGQEKSAVRQGNVNETHEVKVKVKQSRYRPGVAQRVPGS